MPKHTARHMRSKKLWKEWQVRYAIKGHSYQDIAADYISPKGGHYHPDYIRLALHRLRKEEQA